MNISGTQIVGQMEKQLTKLRQAVASGDAAAVREYTAVIESHCELIKGGATQQAVEQVKPVRAMPSMPVTSPSSQAVEVRPLSNPSFQNDPTPKKEDNLLDF
ncbi:YwdI family protein [Bacillus sp. FJAT-45037]|uniref:YwdI family protein n=1 Tax=Bacillus sp. FJAT-45037 TaxID=2011007 RepID=UPI001E57AE3E|nr:YwdI family protein [Bacillus sp. FJAT-45037]